MIPIKLGHCREQYVKCTTGFLCLCHQQQVTGGIIYSGMPPSVHLSINTCFAWQYLCTLRQTTLT